MLLTTIDWNISEGVSWFLNALASDAISQNWITQERKKIKTKMDLQNLGFEDDSFENLQLEVS